MRCVAVLQGCVVVTPLNKEWMAAGGKLPAPSEVANQPPALPPWVRLLHLVSIGKMIQRSNGTKD